MNFSHSVHNNSQTVKKFPLHTFSGSNQEIGHQMGYTLKKEILSTLNFYKATFNREEEDIFKYAMMFKKSIKSFNPDYAIEIETMAETISIDPLWLYALNARSEIMNNLENECTASYFPGERLLGQNWDWSKELEELTFIARLDQEEKPSILQIMEPGIIGKIGLNSYGLGVCLNFLKLPGYTPNGVPTHVLLRGILDCSTIEEAKNLVKKNLTGRTSNLLIADKFGHFFDVEFAGDDYFLFEKTDENFFHTNHYLGENLNPDRIEFASSYARYERALEIANQFNNKANLQNFKSLLFDKTNKELPICRRYEKPKKSLLQNSGTICSLIMDLPNLSMHITRGNPYEHDFEEINMN